MISSDSSLHARARKPASFSVLHHLRTASLPLLVALSWGLPATGQVDPLAAFDQVDPSYVLVTAHRCGYISNGSMTHPENSLSAAQNSIDLGVEVLETDVRMTSDGGLVLMHDSTVNRTTNGSGTVSSMTLAQVRALHLLGPGGVVTTEIVPTLEELMILAKGQVLVNLDKVNINSTTLRDNIMAVLIATDTVDHAIFKGGASAAEVAAMRAAYPGETIHYMPILSNSTEAVMISTLNSHVPPAIELIFNSSNTTMLSPASIAAATATDTHIFINSLWSSLCAGHHDAVALGGDPDGSWGWLVDKGATIIQTDNAPQLIPYLQSLGLRGGVPPVTVLFDFDDGTMQEWTNAWTGSPGSNPDRFEARTDQGRGGGHSPAYSLLHDGSGTWLDGRDVAHDTLVVSSPPFDFDEANPAGRAISFFLLGGTGNPSAAPASLTTLPASTSTSGFLGVALRRVSDGVYLLHDHRDATGQYSAWEGQGWSSAEIAAAVAGDSPGELYQLDLIDQFHGGWGWTILDTVTISGMAEPGVPYCAGDGYGTPCPCNNDNDGSLSGCYWGHPSFPGGGHLAATGSASMSAGDTYLLATGVANDFGIFFGASNRVNGGDGNPLNDGLRCAGGGLLRLIPPTVASGNQMTLPMSVQALDTGAAAGVTRRYQYWFRTPAGPCGLNSNLTNGYEIVWGS